MRGRLHGRLHVPTENPPPPPPPAAAAASLAAAATGKPPPRYPSAPAAAPPAAAVPDARTGSPPATARGRVASLARGLQREAAHGHSDQRQEREQIDLR